MGPHKKRCEKAIKKWKNNCLNLIECSTSDKDKEREKFFKQKAILLLCIYDFMRILVRKMLKIYSPKKSPRMVKNTSPKLVNIKAFHQNFLQKCHHNWWKSGAFTNLGDNSIENVFGLLYANIGLWIFKSCS